MSPKQNNLLIDHLDQTLTGTDLDAVENLIKNDEAAAQEWKLLQFTVANIKEAGLYEQVTAVKNEYNSRQKINEKPRTGIVRSMSQRVMRVAAILLLVTISAALLKYMSVNNSSLYNDYYSTYNLSTSRTAGNDNLLDNTYRDKKWSEVITIVQDISNRNSKHFFLAGIAHLELKQYTQAIASFKSVITKNSISGDDYFNDEAEYYLAMSYLASKQGDKALIILDKINKDRKHVYNNAVDKMGLDFTILTLKERK